MTSTAGTSTVAPVLPRELPLPDGLRGIAALLVLVTHTAFATGTYGAGAMGAVLARFDVGVALFFVLSGFLLTRPWVGRGAAGTREGRRYAVRRAARILPAYWVVLLVVVLVDLPDLTAGQVAINGALLQVYTGDLLTHFTQTWSLCTEVAFYAVLPLLAPWLLRGRGSGPFSGRAARLVLLVAVGLAWTAAAHAELLPWGPTAAMWLPGHLTWFAMGMALAVYEPELRHSPGGAGARELVAHPGTLLALVAALFLVAATPVAGPWGLSAYEPWQAVVKEVLYAAVATALVLGAALGEGGAWSFLRTRPARFLGRVSYGVFLWHLLVAAAVFSVLGLEPFQGGFLLVTVLTVAGSVLVATASFHLVERPFLHRVGARWG